MRKMFGCKQVKSHSFAGTFTLSNLGMFGVDRFDAILPPGQVSNTIVWLPPPPPSLSVFIFLPINQMKNSLMKDSKASTPK